MNTRVSANITVDLPSQTVRDICCNYFKEMLHEKFIDDDGFLCTQEEYHGSHSWFETTQHRKATELEKAVYLIIQNWKDLKLVGKI